MQHELAARTCSFPTHFDKVMDLPVTFQKVKEPGQMCQYSYQLHPVRLNAAISIIVKSLLQGKIIGKHAHFAARWE